MGASRAANRIGVWRELTCCDVGDHCRALILTISDLRIGNKDWLDDLVRQMNSLDGVGRSIVGAACEMIERVFQLVVFRVALVPSANPAQNDCAVGHLRNLVWLNHDATASEIDGERFSAADHAGRTGAMLSARRGHLTSDGAFLIEAFVPDPSRFDRGQRLGALDVETDYVRFEVTQHDPITQSIRSAHVEVSENGVHLYPVRLRYALPAELDLMARLAGMRLRMRYGGWNREPFAASSPFHVSLYELDLEKNLKTAKSSVRKLPSRRKK